MTNLTQAYERECWNLYLAGLMKCNWVFFSVYTSLWLACYQSVDWACFNSARFWIVDCDVRFGTFWVHMNGLFCQKIVSLWFWRNTIFFVFTCLITNQLVWWALPTAWGVNAVPNILSWYVFIHLGKRFCWWLISRICTNLTVHKLHCESAHSACTYAIFFWSCNRLPSFSCLASLEQLSRSDLSNVTFRVDSLFQVRGFAALKIAYLERERTWDMDISSPLLQAMCWEKTKGRRWVCEPIKWKCKIAQPGISCATERLRIMFSPAKSSEIALLPGRGTILTCKVCQEYLHYDFFSYP